MALQLSSGTDELLKQEQLNLGQEDIHICGSCKKVFNDIKIFLHHKNGCNTTLSTATLKQHTTERVSAEPHILEVVVNGKVDCLNLPQSLLLSYDTNLSGEDFKETRENVTFVLYDQTDNNSTDVRSQTHTEQNVANTFSTEIPDIIHLTNRRFPPRNETNSTAQSEALQSSNVQIESKNVRVSDQDAEDNNVKNSTIENKVNVRARRKTNKPGSSRKFYICSSCDFVTLYPNDLSRHTRKHTGERPFECSECSRKFARKDKLQTHFRTHTGEKPYKCQFCDYAAVSICPLRKHLRTHTDERPYKCQFCSYSARDSSTLTVHLRTHTGDAPFFCQFSKCGRAFKTSTDLKRHKLLHTKKNALVCSQCSFKANSEKILQAHNRLRHDGGDDLKCSVENCSFTTNDNKKMLIHKKSHTVTISSDHNTPPKMLHRSACNSRHKSHKSHFCRLCDETGSTITSKSQPKKRHKGNGTNVLNSSVFQKTFQCTYCSISFVRQDSLRIHMKQHQSSSTQDKLQLKASDQDLQTPRCSDKNEIEEASSFFIDYLNSQETLEYSNEI